MLTRDNIKAGIISSMVHTTRASYKILTDEERETSLRETLAVRPAEAGAANDDVWVFAYGSLIWNPAIHTVERRLARLEGFSRQYCLWSPGGRGSEEFPGLMLGLESGGFCDGVVFRIDAAAAAEELDILWRREMVAGSYDPKWLPTRTDAGGVHAITFVINRNSERYVADIANDEVVERLARAKGQLGSCAEYLFNTVNHLRELGLDEQHLFQLADRVADYRRIAGIADD